MAGRGTICAVGRRVRAGVGVLLLALTLAAPLAVAVSAQAVEPRLGDAVTYFGPEGDEAAAIVVEELIDPFRSYDPNSPPERGTHFVLLRLAVENTGGRTLPIDPSAVALQDTLGFLVFPQYVNRGPEATEIDPDLAYGEIAAGQTVRGVLLFQVINEAELARVVFQPGRDRLVILADLRVAADDGADEDARTGGEPDGDAPSDDSAIGATLATGVASHDDATFGFNLTYDGAVWEAAESTDGLTLSNGVSTVQITGSDVLPTEATACVDEVAADLALTSSRQGFAPLEGDDGQPARAGDAGAAFAIFGYTDRAGAAAFEQVGCVALPEGRGVVLFLQHGPLAAVAEEATALRSLLSGLTFEE